MGECVNGRGSGSPILSIDSPPSLPLGGAPVLSGSSSPLLQTEPIPEDEAAVCPYCHKDYRKPRVLDCLHSMCEDCIIAQLDGRREAAKARELAERLATDCVLEEKGVSERPTPPGVIRCPVCFQESHVGNDIRFVHSMLMDYVRLNTSEESKTERNCRACKSEQPAVAYCRQCGSDLCGNCLQAHRDMRLFDGHQVLSYAELEATGRVSETRRVLCPTHALPLLVLCATCQSMACRSCVEFDHGGHNLHEVSQLVVDTISKDMQDHINRLRDRWSSSLEAWHTVPDRLASLHVQYEAAKARIDLAYDDALRVLEESKQRKLTELDEARDKEEATVDDLYRKVDQTQMRVDDAVSFANRLLESANGVELLVSRKKVLQQLSNLEHTMPTLSTEVELEFQPSPRRSMESAMSHIAGLLICRSVPASVRESSVVETAARTSIETDGGGSVSNGGSTGTLAPIGGERAARKKVEGAASSTTPTPTLFVPFNGGWPPSSNPPELPSPSPPKELPSTAASLPLPSAALSPALRLGAAAGFTWPGLAADHAAAAAAAAQQIHLTKLMLQQQQQQQQNRLLAEQLQQRLGRRIDSPLLQQLIADPNLLSTLAAAGGIAGSSSSAPPTRDAGAGEISIAFVFGTGASGQSLRELHSPGGFSISETDDILIADTNNHRIVVVSRVAPWKFGRPGQEDGQLCFPRRTVVMKGCGTGELARWVVIDRSTDSKSRAQIFDGRGEFVRRINLAAVVPKGGIEVWAATSSSAGHLVMLDQSSVVYTLDIKEANPRVVTWFDGSPTLQEASDIAIYDKNIYITDFKSHCVHVYTPEGAYVRKIGEPSHTPFPIGVDVSKKGEVYVAHTHGNKLTVVVYSLDGVQKDYWVNYGFRMSRCTGIRLTSHPSHLVTLSKQAHTLYGFKQKSPR